MVKLMPDMTPATEEETMSELIENAQQRRELLKHMILQLHEGQAPDAVRTQLVRLLGKVPYSEVVAVEQELISEGLPTAEVLKLCDIHTQALKGQIDQTDAKEVPAGHPVHTLKEENRALKWEVELLDKAISTLSDLDANADALEHLQQIRERVHALTDVEKHYARKENLLFPFMEKHELTGPPTVMWGKHDEVREQLKASVEGLGGIAEITAQELISFTSLVLRPLMTAITEMIYKEEEILLPMCLDTLTEQEWYDVYRQSTEIGYCLYDPTEQWQPQGIDTSESATDSGRVQLPSGSFDVAELTAILNTIPFDLTFVDKDDRVRYFTQGRERIFARSRAILGRKVQLCHPPKSAHIVQQILDDFRSGKEDHAPFWINIKDRFISIEYFALRDEDGGYQGTLEVSQDLTAKRALEGEQRLLEYLKDSE